ncbi:AMP-binding protein [Fontimonas sp. SYSU GA230001]|uniref:AMP-binding protein n=1 Tax=Fontimonas sp. SYSU GA230001 TaxID=3142450 RepID=UPI0032B50F93
MQLPLISAFRPDAPLARHEGRWITQGEFVAQAQALAERLPAGRHAINLCMNRYRFLLGFAAASLRGQTSLLPSSPVPAAVAELHRAYADSYPLTDADLPLIDTGRASASPTLGADHLAAILFTSGSTGTPQPQPKRWDTLCAIGAQLSQHLLDGAPAHITATVPSQHMYGLETTVLLALSGACALHDGRPFFPADVARALHELPAPRVLVTTPVHLRALIESQTALPPLRFVLSATAPLTESLAAACESAWGAPVLEIYGCTEAGSTATRRTLDGPAWRLLPGRCLVEREGLTTVQADHLPEAVPLQDVLEPIDAETFRLLGRSGDLLKVAGKRASLADLTQKLQAIPGVIDAVIFAATDGEAARPAALVVAPDLSESAILQALAQQIDPVFLPRPLRKVERLPRNELGKLPRRRLIEMLHD